MTTTPSQIAATHWAMTVPMAEPPMPRSKPYTSTTLSTTFSTFATAATISGVRRSSTPRSAPVAASTTSMAGTAEAEISR
jgi:hypothetical protein